jgi:hypothetical protein
MANSSVLRLGPKGTVRYGPVVFSPVSSDRRFDKSLPAVDLPLFKFMLEYDGDYKDVAEYVFHDIDKKEHQDRIIEHFKTGRRGVGIKVLTHVDDTMYANLIDTRYPKKTLYPGVLEFYDSLKREPFDLTTIPVTTLTVRPSPAVGKFEECSIESLTKLTNGRLSQSSLSGELISGVAGSLGTRESASAGGQGPSRSRRQNRQS